MAERIKIKIKNTILFLLINAFGIVALDAQDIADSVYYIAPIEITADRIHFKDNFNISKTLLLDSLNYRGTMQISDVIDQLPGVYIKDYGGLGGIKTVSLRGCSGNQTAVAINGLNINSSGTGSFDFSNLPSSLFSTVTVMKGGFSAYQGSGAVGGVVDLSLKSKGRKYFDAGVSYGSFNTIEANATYADSIFNTANTLSVNYQHSNSDYAFETQQFGENIEYQRQNAEFDNISACWVNSASLGKRELNSMLLFYQSKRGVPGGVVQGNIENTSTLLEDAKVMAIFNSELLRFDNHSVDVSALIDFGRSYYTDSSNLHYGLPLKTSYYDNNIILKSEYANIMGNLTNNIFAEMRYSGLEGTMLQNAELSNVSRLVSSLFAGSNYVMPLQKIKLQVSGGARLEFADNPDIFVSPLVSINAYFPQVHTGINASYSYNYRLPSFNELYYLNYGNVDLKPEFSHSSNLSFFFDYFTNYRFDASVFLINTVDKIVAVPKSPVTWSVVNMGNTISRGIELGITGSVFEKLLNYHLSYTYQKVTDQTKDSPSYKKQLVYTPEEIISISVEFKPKYFLIGAEAQHVSHRYSMADNNYHSLLPYYLLIDTYIGKNITSQYGEIFLSLGCGNILGETYEVISNYPMAKQKIFFSMKFQQ